MKAAIFLLKRAGQFIVLALLVAMATFCLAAIIPGDFFSARVLESAISADAVAQLRHQYRLDSPFYIQYLYWLKNLARMDLGYSLFYQRPVLQVVADALAKTLWMGIPALVFGFGLGIILGSMHGILRNKTIVRSMDIISSVALSLPSLLLGLAALLLAAKTNWFPLGSMNSLTNQVSGFWQAVEDRLYHLILPVTCLTIPILAYVERIQYSATQNSANDLFVRFARSRGLNRARLFFHYVLRPGLNPILSVSGPMLGGILSGSLVLEVIFAWPGLGQITYDALFNNDLFLVTGCVLGSSCLLIAGNLLADFALLVLDPRTRNSSGS
jgi:peptide/nickel transport system permease protein